MVSACHQRMNDFAFVFFDESWKINTRPTFLLSFELRFGYKKNEKRMWTTKQQIIWLGMNRILELATRTMLGRKKTARKMVRFFINITLYVAIFYAIIMKYFFCCQKSIVFPNGICETNREINQPLTIWHSIYGIHCVFWYACITYPILFSTFYTIRISHIHNEHA